MRHGGQSMNTVRITGGMVVSRALSRYGIRTVKDCSRQHGVYSFYLEDLDHNWWEIQYYDGTQHDDMFDFGDQFGDSDAHESQEGT